MGNSRRASGSTAPDNFNGCETFGMLFLKNPEYLHLQNLPIPL